MNDADLDLNIEHVIFDLDGTLVDSLPGIQQSGDRAVASVLPGCVLPDLRPFIGPPIREILCSALGDALGGDAAARATELESCFRSHYDAEGWRQSRCYPGARDLIGGLCRRGVRCHVVTNKPLLATKQILAHLGLLEGLGGVVSRDSRSPRFASKTEALAHLLRERAIPAGAALMVGDSADDALAARACGLRFAAATYGYGPYNRPPPAPGAAAPEGRDLPEPDFSLTTLSDLSKILYGAPLPGRAGAGDEKV